MGRRNRKDLEAAGDAFLLDLIPDTFIDVATSGTAAVCDLAALDGDDPAGDPVTNVDLRGHRVWLQAVTNDCTVLRGDHETDMTVASGILLDTADNPLRSFYADPKASNNELTHIAAGVGVLRVYYSSDLDDA